MLKLSMSSKNDKKGLFTIILEDTANILLIMVRAVVALGAIIALTIPILFWLLKIVSLILIPLPGTAGDITVILFIFIMIGVFCYATRNKTNKLTGWIMTGHIEIEISDENNRRMRAIWLKAHKNKERTKNVNWKILLTGKSDFHIFETVYPVDKYGHQEITKAPVCFRTLIPVTHKFFGNLPIKGDTINFTWTTNSNNDIKRVYVRAIEYNEADETKDPEWIELDVKGQYGTLFAENVKTGEKRKFKGSVKLSESVKEKIQLCFWYMPEDAEGESVFKLEF